MIPKFRLFDKRFRLMLEVHVIDFYERTIDCYVDDLGVNRQEVYSYEMNEDNYVLMQSTGLADKNGKEIFEGDIVRALSEGYCGTFQVKWRNEGTPMYILYPAWQNEQFWDLKGVNGVDDGIEVIGNIHEHPELLNQPNE